MKLEQLAIFGGNRSVIDMQPHEIWPPAPSLAELNELSEQRISDISIKGRTGIIKEFENKFLEFLHNKMRFAVTFNSGTSALLAAYFALGVRTGDEVIGPALTFHAALSPAFLLGAEIKLVDVERETRCIDVSKIESAITPKTKVITVVHQWGHPTDMDAIVRIAKRNNLLVIEDCSHAHGSLYKGQPVGTFGDIAVFSLQAAKMIYAGEGGILVTNNQDLHDQVTLLGHYRDRSRDEILNPELHKYWVTGYGQKFRMSPLNAVVAKHSLELFNIRKIQRHRCLNYFMQGLESEVDYLENQVIREWADMGAWYGFKPIFLSGKLGNISVEFLVRVLQSEGMEVSKASAPVLSSQPLYSNKINPLTGQNRDNKTYIKDEFNVAIFLEKYQLSLPTFSNWDSDRRLIDQYIFAFKKVKVNIEELYNFEKNMSSTFC